MEKFMLIVMGCVLSLGKMAGLLSPDVAPYAPLAAVMCYGFYVVVGAIERK